MKARWENEKGAIARVRELKERREELNAELERAQRQGQLERAAEIRYGELVALEKELEAEQREARRDPEGGLAAHGGGHRRGDRRDRLEVDRDPGLEDARGRAGEAPPAWRSELRQRVVGQDEALAAVVGRGAPRARRAPGPEPPDRLVHLPRPDRRRQDRARAGARGVPVRRRARDGAHRHERVRRAALGGAADRRAAGLRRLRGGRRAHRGGAAAALQRGALRRDREGAPRRVQRPPADPRRRPAHRRPGPHGRLPQHRPDHDLEHRQPVHRGARRGPARGAAAARRRGAARALQARVPEPDRRDDRVPPARPRALPPRSSTSSSSA